MSNRLQNIATAQSKTRIRDAFFAACVALATVVSISTVSAASHGASTSHPTSAAEVAQR